MYGLRLPLVTAFSLHPLLLHPSPVSSCSRNRKQRRRSAAAGHGSIDHQSSSSVSRKNEGIKKSSSGLGLQLLFADEGAVEAVGDTGQWTS